MGQYGNQPEFATIVEQLTALTTFPKRKIPNSAIYIGALTDPLLDASITVTPVGNNVDVTFSGIKAGTFIPVIITKITSVSNIPNTSILLYN